MNAVSYEQACRVLSRWTGRSSPKLLGEGMEGAVYQIDGTQVAKIWFSSTVEALQRMSGFYDALATKAFSFAVPRIDEICSIDGQLVTIEKRLPGINLSDAISAGTATVSLACATFIDVIVELSESGELPEARSLSVMDENTSLFAGTEDFPAALAGLAARRVRRFGPVLASAVDGLREKSAALAYRLSEVDSGRRTVIHGDMILANILVSRDAKPGAVLDWGFLTTEGDPAFDAAVSAAIFDMYGEDALKRELALYDLFEERLGYDRTAMLAYRAAYSIITANAYDPDGNDGHFEWCAAALNRADVTKALLG